MFFLQRKLKNSDGGEGGAGAEAGEDAGGQMS